jgi:glycerate kinase
MSHVVVAPGKFEGTLTAAKVAAHVAAGFGRARNQGRGSGGISAWYA